ncbi:MAG: DUF507 family protein [Desulfurellaceae bacterium]|nr:DUF507 family protein [Desulfurellaceae bacterium]
MSDLSDNRITALARSALRAIAAEGKIVNERGALVESRRILSSYFQRGDAIDAAVQRKIRSLSRKVAPGSTEWDVLYRRYFEEESRKRKF